MREGACERSFLIHKLQNPHKPKMVLTADLRERCAEYSQNSSISSDSLCIFVRNVVSVGMAFSSYRISMVGGGSDEKMAAAMAAKVVNVENIDNVAVVTSRFL